MSTTSEKPAPTRLQRIGRWTVRLFLTGAILWAGYVTVASWSLLLGETRPAANPAARQAELPASLPAELLAALPQGRSWQFAVPNKPGGQVPAPLLPVPDKVQRLCLQQDEGGVLRAEIHAAALTAEQLAAHWQAAGWQVAWGQSGGDGSKSLVCRKEGDAVRVWTGPLDDQTKQRIVFLVRGEGR
jgi:hypothetical protein